MAEVTTAGGAQRSPEATRGFDIIVCPHGCADPTRRSAGSTLEVPPNEAGPWRGPPDRGRSARPRGRRAPRGRVPAAARRGHVGRGAREGRGGRAARGPDGEGLRGDSSRG